jgi:hypothetical protein
MFGIVGISFDIGGKILVLKGAYNRLQNDDTMGALKLYILGFLFILVSLGASQALTLNMSQDNRTKQFKNSDAYKTTKKAYDISSKSIKDLKNNLNKAIEDKQNMESNKQSNFDEIEKEINNNWKSRIESAKKKNYITTPVTGSIALEGKRDAEIKEAKLNYEKDIVSKDNLIVLLRADIRQEQLNIKDSGGKLSGEIKIESTKGTDNLSMWLSSVFGFKNPYVIDGWINFIFNVLIEILALTLISLADDETKISIFNKLKGIKKNVDGIGFKTQPKEPVTAISPNETIDFKPYSQTKNSIGFEYPVNNIKQFEVKNITGPGHEINNIYVPEKKDSKKLNFEFEVENTLEDMDGINFEDAKTYLIEMFDNQKIEGQSPSIATMTKLLNNKITPQQGQKHSEYVRTIRGMLTRKGVLESISDKNPTKNKTLILKSRKELGI